MSKVIINGIVCWVNDPDFIVIDEGEYIHCKSARPPSINEHVNLHGRISSSTRSFNGKEFISFYVEV